ncbi:MAG: hypothetical protein P8J33_02695 [Pirellulaceae bacterium]|nr:hypothetical protein [Pirellulaceae bacterium]
MAKRPLKSNQKISLTGSCLICQEIELRQNAEHAWEIRNACSACHREIEVFLAASTTVSETETEDAIRDAGQLLRNAKLPLICGLADQSLETQKAAIALAKNADAAIDWTNNGAPFAVHRAVQETGFVTCTYGEIRDRADLIIHWSNHLTTSHPTFLKRFTTGKPTISVDWERDSQIAALHFLRAGDRDISAPPEWAALADAINAATYPVILIDDDNVEALGDDGMLSLLRFIRQQNDRNHCRLVHLPSQGNSTGIQSALTSLTGGPLGITFRDGHPFYRGSEFCVQTLLADGVIDLLLLVGSTQQIDCKLIPHSLPVVWICDQYDPQSASELPTHIRIPTARWGLDIKGTGIRADGMPLNRPAIFASDGMDPATALSRLEKTTPHHSGDPS